MPERGLLAPILLVMANLVLAGCATGPNPFQDLAQDEPQGREAPLESGPHLQVLGVHGARNATTEAGLWDVHVDLFLPMGIVPQDVSKLLLRYEHGDTLRTYAHSALALPDGAAPSPTFDATRLHGEQDRFTIEGGQRVQIHFNLMDHTLPPRSVVSLWIVPEASASTNASFWTPSTYGNATALTLR